MRPKGISGNAGFTLMEILIGITIFTIIATVIYSSLNAGIRIWNRSNRMIAGLQSARVFFALASSDLRNAIIYDTKGINFEGSPSGMAFMTVVTAAGKEYTQGPELVKVAYYLDSRTETVKRAVAGKAKGFDTGKAKPATLFTGVRGKDFSFEYYYTSEFTKTGCEWKDEWADTGKVPAGVRIKVKGFTRYIFIPTGEPGGEIED